MHRLTAAHRNLPLGTTVVVTNLQTRRQVVVRINDRGPYVEPERRILDLSRAAARRIGLEQPGLAPVRVVIKRSPKRPTAVAAGRPTSAKTSPPSPGGARAGPQATGEGGGGRADGCQGPHQRLSGVWLLSPPGPGTINATCHVAGGRDFWLWCNA